MSSDRLLGKDLLRDLFVMDDESNPRGSKRNKVYPTTTLDQVFDDKSPINKNLRTILEELKQEILTGGLGNINFPVTSVNGLTGDVELDKTKLGLGRVDNTADVDKPLSGPQRNTIMEILSNYNFKVNLQSLYDHIMDTNNPHNVRLEQLNENNELQEYISLLINQHSLSTSDTVHRDIRRSLMRLWSRVDDLDNTIEERLGYVLEELDRHLGDENSHEELFAKKEDIVNKVTGFSKTENNDNYKFPTTRAVSEYVTNAINEYAKTTQSIDDWIEDIKVCDSRSTLPQANPSTLRHMYFIRRGNDSHSEIAICRKSDNNYTWDISTLGDYTLFDDTYFEDSVDGITIKMSAIIDAIISENGMLDTTLSDALSKYYDKDEIDKKHFIDGIKIIPGTVDGTIRYYINDNPSTISDDIQVTGLKRLAYLEWVTENEIKEQAVQSKHIISNAIESRHIQDKSIDSTKLSCHYGNIFCNNDDPDGTTTKEITLVQLAEYLRPLIGGWPDPAVPGENPWANILDDRMISPQNWDPGIEHNLFDNSYAMRFKGEISCLRNIDIKTPLTSDITSDDYVLIGGGGGWEYQSDPKEWTLLGGSNITGHTFGTINITKSGVEFESISIGDRMNSTYDIWIRYIKKSEFNKIKGYH